MENSLLRATVYMPLQEGTKSHIIGLTAVILFQFPQLMYLQRCVKVGAIPLFLAVTKKNVTDYFFKLNNTITMPVI